MNNQIVDVAEIYSQLKKIKIYVTPSSFLELVKVFINLMKI